MGIQKASHEECFSRRRGGGACRVRQDDRNAELVVLVDSGLGYYEKHDAPKAVVRTGQTPWIVVKLGGTGLLDRSCNLWIRDLPRHRDRVVVVTTADDLRQAAGVEISKGTAWELAAADCARLLRRKERLNQFRFVLVSFGPAGVVLFDREKMGAGSDCLLVFDSGRVEGAPDFWLNGKMWGYTSVLTTALVYEIIRDLQGGENITGDTAEHAVRRGLTAMKALYDEGFGRVVTNGKEKKRSIPVFPYRSVREAIEGNPREFAKAVIEAEEPAARTLGLRPSWAIAQSEDPHEVARNIVNLGIEKALEGVPRLRCDSIVTVDRREIESFQSVRALVREYAEKRVTRAQRYWEKSVATPTPLSIAIFGAPGSGKSTAVQGVIGSVRIPEKDFQFEEFNLSQFRGTTELVGAFHRIRDDQLRGKMPVVLWDEFDTTFDGGALGWLRYFLSPMQDGVFQEGQDLHPTGRAVFVFAGGVSTSLENFKSLPNYVQFKGPDFLSRVRGIMELQGIDESYGDSQWVIRRAILLRGILEKETRIFEDGAFGEDAIDPQVVNAFLGVSSFNHGVRSMKAIVQNSSLLGEHYFGRSALPSETQLALHVNAVAFYNAMDK
ncbi:hypothetical protein [Streptomyces sp. NPDC049585]|uniref:hypothetical protein n=1 Tax=Streptomyces sp. NPDC049585 TaxID=3155154 RepID=UPI00342BCD88